MKGTAFLVTESTNCVPLRRPILHSREKIVQLRQSDVDVNNFLQFFGPGAHKIIRVKIPPSELTLYTRFHPGRQKN
jgi:hypothetical protein